MKAKSSFVKFVKSMTLSYLILKIIIIYYYKYKSVMDLTNLTKSQTEKNKAKYIKQTPSTLHPEYISILGLYLHLGLVLLSLLFEGKNKNEGVEQSYYRNNKIHQSL